MAPKKKPKKQRVLLIDADTLVYEFASTGEKAINWGDEPNGQEDLWTIHANEEAAIAGLDGKVESLKERLNATAVVMALSDYTDPWRKKVMPDYKRQRAANRKPLLIPELREHISKTYQTFQRPGLEGDDVLGILLTVGPLKNFPDGERILVSIDKDMRTLPGKHYNPKTDERFEVSQEEANKFHMKQTLMGDRVDGYPGCPGIGEVKADKLLGGLTTVAEMWPVVVAAYQKAGQDEEDALVNARVARICRAEDYDFKAKQVRLWNPPK